MMRKWKNNRSWAKSASKAGNPTACLLITVGKIGGFFMAIEKVSYEVFRVEYIRQRGVNQWKAKTTEEIGLKAIDTEAVMGLATPHREGETETEEKYAIVHVSVKCDPRYFGMSPELEEGRIAMLEKANHIADQKFLKRHPYAKIEHC
jgi:hypothetical protein